MVDKRIPKMQEMLEDVLMKIQNLYIQATGGNVVNLYESIIKLQTVYNTLSNIKEQQETGAGDNGNGNERENNIE
jgi:hypothetical protein